MAQSLDLLKVGVEVRRKYRASTTATMPISAGRDVYTEKLLQGTGAGFGNRFFRNTYTIAGATRQTLDLAGGITDEHGLTLTFTKIKGIFIKVTNTTLGGPVLVGGGSDGAGTTAFIGWINAVAAEVQVRRPGCMLFSCDDTTSYAVTATTADVLGILNEHATIAATVLVCLWGEGS